MLIVLLYEAVSDVDAVVAITPETSGQHEVDELRNLIRSASNRIRKWQIEFRVSLRADKGFLETRMSASAEGQNKSRLYQLSMTLQLQLDAAIKRRRREDRRELKNLAATEGKGGQTKLAFGKMREGPSGSAETTEVEGVEGGL